MMAAERGGPLRVVGRYALYNEIAAGGMATVHIGRLLGPVGFARTVAIKRLHPQFAKDPEFVSMFLDEARLAARVQHPNVVATIDVVATDGELFLIMDYVRGESLSKLIRMARKAGTNIPPRIAASIICGFLHGLHAAHEAKNERGDRIDLVHRDVSPQNVLVGADGIPRVLDFGIAKAAGRIQVTRDGQIKGKLAYMPPEQLSGREVTRAVDIYASAVVMWETLTGERLFKGETESETLAKILRDPVVPPSDVVPGLPRAFDAPLLRALSRDAAKRHATARELAFELEKCVGVASASEVGEWVENIVGTILSAREDTIAEIESNSASLRVSQSVRSGEDSDSDAVVQRSAYSAQAAQAAQAGHAGTMLGIGPPSGTVPMARQQGSFTETSADASGTASARTDRADAAAASEEGTGSKVTGTRVTGTMSLPVNRRLPIVASALGLLVLLTVMGVVLLGRGPSVPPGGAPPGPSASTTGAGVAAPGSAVTAPSSAPEPPSTGAIGTVDSAQPAAEIKPVPQHTAAPAHTAVRPPVATVPPPRTATPAPPPVTRKNCDPPYTIDTNGRKKYKLECM